jgi:hypothetical protein
MVFFHKYLIGKKFPGYTVENGAQISNIQNVELDENSNTTDSFSNYFKDFEIAYLSSFFLASKICNCLTSVTRISLHYINQLFLSSPEFINKPNHNSVNFQKNCNITKIKNRKNSKDFCNFNTFSKSKPLGSNNVSNNIQPSGNTNVVTMNNVNGFSLNYINTNSNGNSTNLNNAANKSIEKIDEEIDNFYETKREFLKKKLEEKIKEKEMEILKITGFDINVDLPYIYIEKMKGYLVEYLPKGEKLIDIVYNFVNDSFKLPVCLYYSPLKIALAAISLLNHHFNVDLVPTEQNIPWYQIIDKDIDIQEIKTLASQMNLLYTLPRNIHKNGENINKDMVKAFKSALTVINNKSMNKEKEKNEKFSLNSKSNNHMSALTKNSQLNTDLNTNSNNKDENLNINKFSISFLGKKTIFKQSLESLDINKNVNNRFSQNYLNEVKVEIIENKHNMDNGSSDSNLEKSCKEETFKGKCNVIKFYNYVIFSLQIVNFITDLLNNHRLLFTTIFLVLNTDVDIIDKNNTPKFNSSRKYSDSIKINSINIVDRYIPLSSTKQDVMSNYNLESVPNTNDSKIESYAETVLQTVEETSNDSSYNLFKNQNYNLPLIQ